MSISLPGTIFADSYCCREMIKQGTGGSIVFTASIAGHRAALQLKNHLFVPLGSSSSGGPP